MLATQATGDLGGHTAEHFVSAVHQIPAVLDLVGLGGEGFHVAIQNGDFRRAVDFMALASPCQTRLVAKIQTAGMTIEKSG
jgi:hypothetical protein